MDVQNSDLITTLQKLTEGLLWMSETDAPFEVICWQQQAIENLTNEKLLELTNHSQETLVEAIDLDVFFARVIREQDWFGENEKKTAAQYESLVSALRQHLSHLKVYRVGEITVDIYIVGQTKEGDLMGLSTHAVET